MSRYLAVRIPQGPGLTFYYVIDVETGFPVTGHGTWEAAQATAKMGNELPDRWQCSQCKRILPDGALVGTCPDCQCQRLERA